MECSRSGIILDSVIKDLKNGDMELKVKDADVPKSLITSMEQDYLNLSAKANKKQELKFTAVKPKNKNSAVKKLFASYYKGREVARPQQILKTVIDNKEWFLVGNGNGSVSVFNSSRKLVGFLGINTSEDKKFGIYNAKVIAVSEDNSKIAIASNDSDTVEIYELLCNKETLTLGAKLGRVGKWRESNSEVATGLLQDPHGICFLENGNILVGCYYGYAPDKDGNKSRRYGHVSEYKITGEYVKTHLGNFGNGMPWNKETAPVRAMKKYGEYIFISTTADLVAVFREVAGELVYVKSISNNTPAGKVDPCGVCFRDNKLYITMDSVAKIAIVDFESLEVLKVIGKPAWDDWSVAKNNLNEFWSPKDIEYIGNDEFLVCDYGNNRVMYFYEEEEEAKYDLPSDLQEIVFADEDISKDGVLKISKGADAPVVHLVYKAKGE